VRHLPAKRFVLTRVEDAAPPALIPLIKALDKQSHLFSLYLATYLDQGEKGDADLYLDVHVWEFRDGKSHVWLDSGAIINQ
jgi:hypothetical protein